jgi:hypothetical protein
MLAAIGKTKQTKMRIIMFCASTFITADWSTDQSSGTATGGQASIGMMMFKFHCPGQN